MTADDLKAWRKAMGNLSQRQVGELLGYSRPQIARYEGGKAPIPVSVGLACAALIRGIGPYSKPEENQ